MKKIDILIFIFGFIGSVLYYIFSQDITAAGIIGTILVMGLYNMSIILDLKEEMRTKRRRRISY